MVDVLRYYEDRTPKSGILEVHKNGDDDNKEGRPIECIILGPLFLNVATAVHFAGLKWDARITSDEELNLERQEESMGFARDTAETYKGIKAELHRAKEELAVLETELAELRRSLTTVKAVAAEGSSGPIYYKWLLVALQKEKVAGLEKDEEDVIGKKCTTTIEKFAVRIEPYANVTIQGIGPEIVHVVWNPVQKRETRRRVSVQVTRNSTTLTNVKSNNLCSMGSRGHHGSEKNGIPPNSHGTTAGETKRDREIVPAVTERGQKFQKIG